MPLGDNGTPTIPPQDSGRNEDDGKEEEQDCVGNGGDEMHSSTIDSRVDGDTDGGTEGSENTLDTEPCLFLKKHYPAASHHDQPEHQ